MIEVIPPVAAVELDEIVLSQIMGIDNILRHQITRGDAASVQDSKRGMFQWFNKRTPHAVHRCQFGAPNPV